MFIAKLQRPLLTNAEVPQVLIYNQSRSVEFEMDLTPELEKLFGEKNKIFAKCSIVKENLVIGDLVRSQEW
jgi:hypothetical protein